MNKNNKKKQQMTVDGMMTFDRLQNGLHTADFVSTEYLEMEPFAGDFRVQVMSNGSVTMVQKPRRIRRGPLRRGNRWSISVTRDGLLLIGWRLPVTDIRHASKIFKKDAREIAEEIEDVYEEEGGDL